MDQNVSDRVALQVMEEQKQFPGVTAQVQPVIEYPQPDGANPAQVLGYLQPITPQEIASRHLPVTGFSGVDLVGQAGLEAQYDSQLRGQAGTQVVSVNAAGDVTGTVSQTPPVNGDDLVTSLNAQIQADAQNALNGAIARSRAAGNNANQGAAIVMTTTGRVVAMASYPDYNPSVWTGGISQQEFNALFGTADGQPIINWTTQGQYAPGSTFKVTSTAAAVADGYPLNGLYNCPGSVSIGGQTFGNDGEPSLGDMTFAEALIQSCDTVYYNLGYDMYLSDNVKANSVKSPNAPVQKMQQMELAWGFGQDTGIDLPAESTGTIPTRQWLYYLWKDNAYTGQDWCKNGRQYGSYVQQIEYQDCQSGWVVGARPGGHRRDRPGLRDRHPAPARRRLRGAGQRRHAVQPADRRGAGLADHRPGGPADQPARHPPPARVRIHAVLHPQRAGRRGDPGHRGRRLRRLPAQQGLRGGQDGYRPAVRQERDLGVRLVRAVQRPEVRGPRHGPGLRLRCRRGGARGPADLGRHLRPGGAQGGGARRPGAVLAAADLPDRDDHRAVRLYQGEVMLGRTTSYTARGLTTPRPGVFSGRRPRSLLARAFARNSPLRHMDWLLVVVVLGLSAIGTLLVWSATQPSLLAAGADPRTYLKKQLLNVVIGLVLMAGVSLVDTRQLRTWVPFFYGATVLGLLAVLTPIGSDINGAHAWISLPGGFQVEPSEFAKVALILGIAMIFSQARPGISGGPGVRSLLIALACAAPLIGLVVIEPALGVALVLVVVTATMIVLSGLRLRIIAALAGLVAVTIAAAGGLHLLKSYQLTRFTSFLHPAADLAGAGYNAAQAKIAVGSGGMFGQGLFHGQLVAGNFVPSQQTDFIFTVAGEELGFVGTIVIVFLLGVVIVRALRIATRADDLFGLLVASGIAMWFAFQSFVNIGMTIGIMPITGLPLPFVSYGGSAVFADMIAIGLLQSVHRRRTVFE